MIHNQTHFRYHAQRRVRPSIGERVKKLVHALTRPFETIYDRRTRKLAERRRVTIAERAYQAVREGKRECILDRPGRAEKRTPA
jgi:hypothetical protein